MKVIEVSSPKGGVGVTSVAGMIALSASNVGLKVLFIDKARNNDIMPWAGLMTLNSNEVEESRIDNLSTLRVNPNEGFVKIPKGFDFVVIDGGNSTSGVLSDGEPVSLTRVGVTRNCYVSLKSIMNSNDYDRFVCIVENDRPLLFSDVNHILRGEATRVNYDVAVARSIDAGMIADRSHLYEWAKEFAISALI